MLKMPTYNKNTHTKGKKKKKTDSKFAPSILSSNIAMPKHKAGLT